MSISGIVNTHFIVAYLVTQHGSAAQKAPACCRRMATGRGARRVLHVEPAAARTSRRSAQGVPAGPDYVLNGQKMWLTNGAYSGRGGHVVRTDWARIRSMAT